MRYKLRPESVVLWSGLSLCFKRLRDVLFYETVLATSLRFVFWGESLNGYAG